VARLASTRAPQLSPRARRGHARAAALGFAALGLAALATPTGCASGDDAGSCEPGREAQGTRLQLVEIDATLDAFFAHPWPSDARRDDTRLFLAGFPNPTVSRTLDEYLTTIAASTTRYSRVAAIYASFSGPIDATRLPQTARGATTATATVQLVDVDPRSPERGRRIPIDVRASADATTYLPAHHLIAMPPFGVVLRPATTYALVVTDGLVDAEGERLVRARAFARALEADCEGDTITAAFAPLRAAIDDGLVDGDRVVGGTVFSTQDVIGEIQALQRSVDAQPLPAIEGLTALRGTTSAHHLTGQVDLPSFQHGRPPFESRGDGGAFARGADGLFTVHHQERAGVAFAIPRRLEMPEAGWPVVVFAHGTGGSARDALDGTIGEQLTRLGIAVVGYDGVLHGPRDPTGAAPELRFFNFLNVEAARDNVRQGAADNALVARLVTGGLELPGSLVGGAQPVRFDASRLGYVGHSQGGLVGAPYVAMDPKLKTAVFSGTSGILIITLLQRKDPVDFLGLLRTVLDMPSGEVVDRFHPVLSLMQTFIEPADPIAYGPAFLDAPPGGAPRDVLFVEGFRDFASPAEGHEALAAASGAPLAPTHHRNPRASDLLGIAPIAAPVRENAAAGSGRATIGLIQYPEQTHFPIYDDADAKARYKEFIRSGLLDGRSVIVAPSR
jgi:hypothetical protein